MPGVADVRLHTGDDVMSICGMAGQLLGQPDPPLPYWAFPWAGGLAVARYLADHPDEVAGRTVLDLGSGSGLCAIVALRSGATSVVAADIDPLAEAAVALNARANGVRIGFSRGDPLEQATPDVDVILAGDVCYEETMARRTLSWLRGAAALGVRVLVGDPGRRYLPGGLRRIATYRVTTSLELEDAEVKDAAVYTLGAGAG